MIDEPPPFLGTWRRVYAAVLAWLAVLMLLFWLFTRAFAPDDGGAGSQPAAVSQAAKLP